MAKIIGTDQNFESEVMQEKSKPVLVDFWATWCGPCRVQGPIVEELAQEMGDQVKVVKFDVDESPNTPSKFSVLSIPTLMIFKDGKLEWQGVGVHQKQALQSELKKLL